MFWLLADGAELLGVARRARTLCLRRGMEGMGCMTACARDARRVGGFFTGTKVAVTARAWCGTLLCLLGMGIVTARAGRARIHARIVLELDIAMAAHTHVL